MTQSLPTDTNSLQSSSYCHTGGTGTDMLQTRTNAVFPTSFSQKTSSERTR